MSKSKYFGSQDKKRFIQKSIENVFEIFEQHFYPWSFPSLLAFVGVTIEKGFALVAEGKHCSRLQRGIAPWSCIAPLRAGGALATASPSALWPPSHTYQVSQ